MNEIPTIANLRKLAELNFGPECYKKYLALIEPGIKSIIENYFSGWKNLESTINQMVMKHKGIFKTDLIVISIDSKADEQYVDTKAFNKIKNQSFKQKIDYLRKNEILGDSSYKLLDLLREKRNKIHEPGVNFSEQELAEFSYAHSIVWFILIPMISHSPQKRDLNYMKENAEKSAKYFLSKIENKSGSGEKETKQVN